MKNLIKLFSLICLLVFLTTCKKEEEQQTPSGIIIAEDVKVINNQTWEDQFISLDTASYTITFSNNDAAIQNLEVGDIILSSSGEGLLRKVKNVSMLNDQIKVQTEAAAITEVIQQGLIEVDQFLTVSQIKSIDYHYVGVNLKNDKNKSGQQTQLNWDINTVLYDKDGKSATTGDQIKLVGEFNCDWRVKMKIDVRLFEGLKEVNFGYETNENLDLKLIAGLEYNFEKSITLATVNFTPIVVSIGIVPIVFTPQLKIIVGINGSANASITSSIEQSLTFNAGIKYLKGKGWAPYQTFTKEFSFEPPQLNLNASATAYIKPELLIKLYAVAGPYANLRLYGRLDADLLKSPWWNLYVGLKMNAGAKVSILDKFILEYNIDDLINYEQLLAQSTSPPVSLPTVTTNNVSLITTTTADVGGNVTSDGGATVSSRGVYYGTTPNPETTGIKFQIGSGTGSFSSSLTGLTANTLYYIKAFATNSKGTNYGNELSFNTAPANNSPTVPSNPSPVNGAKEQSTSPALSWSCSDPEGDPITYDLYFGTTNSLTTPIITDLVTSESSQTDLAFNTTYYWKIVAKDNKGNSSISDVWSFTTKQDGGLGDIIFNPNVTYGTVTDIDGNTYKTITIGTQTWMAENLKTTRYNDGATIPLVTENETWGSLITPAYCWYDNDSNKKPFYGALYNWHAVNNTKLAPTGWHVPTDAEWQILVDYLGGEGDAGGKLKEIGFTHWEDPNTGANNESGFTAMPGGFRSYNGLFYRIGQYGNWWSTTVDDTGDAWYRGMFYNYSSVGRYGYNYHYGFSVRCMQD